MKKYMMMVLVIGFVAFGAFEARAEVTREMIDACGDDVQAILALLPQAENEGQTDLVQYSAIRANGADTAIAFADQIAASERNKLRATIIQRTKEKNMKDRTLAAKEYFEKYNGMWLGVNPRFLTREEAVEFYELVLKNVPLTEETKEKLGKIKGELLKLKDL